MNVLDDVIEMNNTKDLVTALKEERRTLVVSIKEAEEELKAMKGRCQTLMNSWNGRGLIAQAREKLGSLRLKVRDSTARQVVWKKQDEYCGKKDYVVVKVTKQRIYVRQAGHSNSSYYNKETGVGRGTFPSIIDLEATFPEGVDNFKKDES